MRSWVDFSSAWIWCKLDLETKPHRPESRASGHLWQVSAGTCSNTGENTRVESLSSPDFTNNMMLDWFHTYSLSIELMSIPLLEAFIQPVTNVQYLASAAHSRLLFEH